MANKKKDLQEMEVSEQVEVSANKLQILMAQHQTYKENAVGEIARLKAQLKSKEEQIRLCLDALNQMKMMKNTKTKNGGTDKIMEEMAKSKNFDNWLAEHKEELVDKEYEKYYKREVDELNKKLEQMFK